MNIALNRRRFLKQTAAGVSLLPLSIQASSPAQNPELTKKPSFLFLLADDYRFDCIHALGCDEIQTPHLDRLIGAGTSFTNCYNQGGWQGAICVASRTMLLTGCFLWKAQNRVLSMNETDAAGLLWPQQLQHAGYHTYLSGKWHVECKPGAIFQTVRNVRPGMPPDVPAQYERPKVGKDDPYNASDPSPGGYFSGGQHWSETVAEDGISFIREAAQHDEPFFMYLSFNAPHDPRQSPEAYLRLYDPENLSLPENFLPEYPDNQAIGCGPDLRDERLAPFPRTPQAIRAHRREYYALITHLDAQIGRILDALHRSGRGDSTYVIFTADNGLALGSHGLMGKQNMYEHSMKVPFVLSGPGILAGHRLNALIYMQDIAPTLLELAGISPSEPMDYQSLVPLLSGTRRSGYNAIYGAYLDLQRMIRIGGHKLIYYPALERFLLFDLEKDPHEIHDCIDVRQEAATISELKDNLRSLQLQLGDRLDIPV